MFEIYDEVLVERLKSERKVELDELHASYVAEARKKIPEFKEANSNPEGETALMGRDLEERVAQLAALASANDDEGLVVDVVAWHDGDSWRAAIFDGVHWVPALG